MKTINIALTEKAHENLRELCRKEKKNQSDVVSDILEKVKA